MDALDLVLPDLRCPVCREELRRDGGRLGCGRGHSFDVARQGYVNLTGGGRGPGTGDTAAMVAARADFLAAGHYAPISDRLAATAHGDGLVLDLAGGTGHYLAAVLDGAPAAVGVCADLSTPALRRAARAHPRAAAIGADAWQPLPLRDGSVRTVLSVFGPRNPSELERVLAPDGQVVVVAPQPDHLAGLVEPLGMISVAPDKADRQAATFGRFDAVTSESIRFDLDLDHAAVAAVVGMGPTASHVGEAELAGRIAGLPATSRVGVAVTLTVYRRGAAAEADAAR